MQARWRRIRRVVDAAALAFTLLVIFFIYSAVRSEPLPDLSWLTENKPYHALKENEKAKAREKRRHEPFTVQWLAALLPRPLAKRLIQVVRHVFDIKSRHSYVL